MTVCVAAIAQKSVLIGASDRMLTAGDIEFETGQAKMWQFSNSILGLVSGHAAIQGEIFKRTNREVDQWIANSPKTWVNVKDVASLYCKKYRELLCENAEREILHPLGMTLASFLEKQSTMHSKLVSDIADRLMQYQFPSILEAIFMGIDNDGPLLAEKKLGNYAQLYVTEADKLECLNTIGFAAIGIGKSHADSQFMASGHWPFKPFEETILLAYTAKKRAEVAPGVGELTDMVVIGPGIGFLQKVEDKHVKKLDVIYKKNQRATERALKKAQVECKQAIEEIKSEYAKIREEEAAETDSKPSISQRSERET